MKSLLRIRDPLDPKDGQRNGLEMVGQPSLEFVNTQSLFQMTSELSTLIHGFKYRQLKRHIPFLCQYLRFRPLLLKDLEDVDALVPVPIHPIRFRERGYNQAEVIAREVSKIVGKPVITDLLVRNRNTKSQTKLTREARRQNLKQAFSLPNSNRLVGQRVLLIDDVFTTGATAAACGELLWKAGCQSVRFFSLAKVDVVEGRGDFDLEMMALTGFLT